MDTENYKKLIKWVNDNKNKGYSKEEIWEKVKYYKLNTNPIYFNAVLLYNSDSIDINEAIDEWIYDIKPVDETDQCICTHAIQQNFYIINTINNNRLIIGSDCINKFLNENVKDIHQLCEKIGKYKGDKRLCRSCCNFKISDDKSEHIKYCKSCYQTGIIPSRLYQEYESLYRKNKYRKCISCNMYNIEMNKPNYYKKCYNCHFN
jgi:hypothetical protein